MLNREMLGLQGVDAKENQPRRKNGALTSAGGQKKKEGVSTEVKNLPATRAAVRGVVGTK